MQLSVEEVLEIHELLVEWFEDSEDPISPPGLKNRNLLESAVGRPFQTVGGKDSYPSPFDKAAALFHSLVNNHAFHNGNKRIALTASQVLLDQIGQWLEKSTDNEMYEFTRQAAAHEICEKRVDEVATISQWLETNSRKAIRGEHPLKYSQLKEALSRFGFELDPPEGDNLLSVWKDGKVVERVSKQGIKGFRPYHTDYILGLRKRLGLTPENGVDSLIFYGRRGPTDAASDFIELRIEVMRRLAKT
ncbi:type II toxin-antitoxin system death-on-curing family toxin [Brevundimonas mediterranea]|uniref:Death-on-curing protein n=1 Tax=Brevundimonas mediterranea TaxID=74329 RepID=A0A7W6EZL6_9CAUL|nr:Fic family protein [Brevundimonas mediterranea]MBB3871828.1 death-on-curing protein [Brevundimonas mediterranea]